MDLPDDDNGPGWIGYSQHSYETLPLRTEHIKGSRSCSLETMRLMPILRIVTIFL